jgi:hypothetical protein
MIYLLEPPKDEKCERAKFAVFSECCRILDTEGVPYVMGGGVAIRAYGRTRPLKDADIFLERKHVYPAMDVLTKKGGFHTREMDATWLYKALKHDILVDIIVRTTGNVLLNEAAYAHSRMVELYGYTYRMMGPEDLLFRKILSHREGRPDQFDALSMFENPVADFDWDYFYDMVEANGCHRKILGFLLWIQAEMATDLIPRGIICRLTDAVMQEYCIQETA